MEIGQSKKDVEGQNSSQCMTAEDTNIVLSKLNSRGGWTTFPFLLGCMFAITLASGGLVGNLIVYLITKYNVKSIDATKINNVVLGCSFLIPIAGAILVDSFYGSFVVIAVFLIVSLMGMTLMTLTASLSSLRPSSCTNMSLPSLFTSIARVIVAAVRKRNISSRNQEYNYDIDIKSTTSPSDSFRFLNRGAIKTESDGPKSKSSSLSSVQEVEDLKMLIRKRSATYVPLALS
ncbi:NRT1/ PTR family 2.7-like protein [Tanacetum coccineum]|uniref:NRT1/ PTR family 2.7-like protein n=1 Tax=Tanacetum coccineum TaxID=301880 RepID=A0ABQ4YEB0_9ASTR